MGCYRRVLVFVVLFGYAIITVLGEVRVRIQNKLECGQSMAIHCQSRDDDIGNLVVPSGYEMEWTFNVNVWGTTLFYCDVEWSGSKRHHFDAYHFARDSSRCWSECVWMITRNESLYLRDQQTDRWDWVPFEDHD